MGIIVNVVLCFNFIVNYLLANDKKLAAVTKALDEVNGVDLLNELSIDFADCLSELEKNDCSIFNDKTIDVNPL